jgi:hypothetical protein
MACATAFWRESFRWLLLSPLLRSDSCFFATSHSASLLLLLIAPLIKACRCRPGRFSSSVRSTPVMMMSLVHRSSIRSISPQAVAQAVGMARNPLLFQWSGMLIER